MSFLDSLEDNLKALESQQPGGLDDSRRRREERAQALAAAPWADKLKNGQFVKTLMGDLTRAGFARRMKVNFIWVGAALRMEAAGERLELQPTPHGIEVVFPDRRAPLDIAGKPDSLIRDWLKTLDRKLEERKAAPVEMDEE